MGNKLLINYCYFIIFFLFNLLLFHDHIYAGEKTTKLSHKFYFSLKICFENNITNETNKKNIYPIFELSLGTFK